MTLKWLDNFSNDELKLFLTELIQDISPSGEYTMDLIDELTELRQNSEFANDAIIKWYKLSQGK